MAQAQAIPDGAAVVAATASPSPSPSPAPSDSPAPKKKSRLDIGIQSYTSGINQQMVGPGISPAEAKAFIAGGAVHPGGPYDFFTGGPLVTGMGIHQAMELKPTYALTPAWDLTAAAGYGTSGGSGNVASYWGDAMMPPLNPQLGQRTVTVPPAFPTHNGNNNDPALQATRLSALQAALVRHDGDGALSIGWVDLHQSMSTVFSAPAWPNTGAILVPLPPEQIGEPSPGVALNFGSPTTLPLHGIDAWGKTGIATYEMADADLPSAAIAPARLQTASMFLTHSQRLGYSFQVATLNQGGPIVSPVLFGAGATTTASAQGPIPQSTLYGQKLTVFGGAAVFPLGDNDYSFKYSFSCYGATGVPVAKSACVGGNYIDATVRHGFADFDLTLEAVRREATFAPAILTYGMTENVWDISYAWPRAWFRDAYPFAGDSRVGPNRQGFRASTTFIYHGIETRLSAAAYWQIQAYDLTNGLQPGFVESYFTPQTTTTAGTLGRETHAAASFAWHPKFADVRLDLTDAVAFRAPTAALVSDAVAMNYPAAVLSLSRQINSRMFGAIGAGRTAVDGSYDNVGAKNADLAQSVIFGGIEYHSNPTSTYHIQYRLYSVHGIPTATGGPSPAFHGPQIIFEQLMKT